MAVLPVPNAIGRGFPLTDVEKRNTINDIDEEKEGRFRRQIQCEAFGETGQRRLARGRVLIVGCGALGGAAANLLARAGVGFLRLVDPDIVERDNLHRQLLFSEADATERRTKVDAARAALKQGNASVRIETIQERFHPQNAERLISVAENNEGRPASSAAGFSGDRVDVILDGCDNFPTRWAMNAAAVRFGIPFVSAGLCAAGGQALTVLPGETPCLACLFGELPEESPPNEIERFGVLAPIVQVLAAMEAMETLKILAGRPEAVRRSLLHLDLWENRFRELATENARDPACPVCGGIAEKTGRE